MDSSGDIATVTVHIRKLRGKLETNPKNPDYIETVWGQATGLPFKFREKLVSVYILLIILTLGVSFVLYSIDTGKNNQ